MSFKYLFVELFQTPFGSPELRQTLHLSGPPLRDVYADDRSQEVNEVVDICARRYAVATQSDLFGDYFLHGPLNPNGLSLRPSVDDALSDVVGNSRLDSIVLGE